MTNYWEILRVAVASALSEDCLGVSAAHLAAHVCAEPLSFIGPFDLRPVDRRRNQMTLKLHSYTHAGKRPLESTGRYVLEYIYLYLYVVWPRQLCCSMGRHAEIPSITDHVMVATHRCTHLWSVCLAVLESTRAPPHGIRHLLALPELEEAPVMPT